MYVFIFERIANATDYYHPEGGVVIIAKDRAEAQALVDDYLYLTITETEWANSTIFKIVGKAVPQIWVMPDAGCDFCFG